MCVEVQNIIREDARVAFILESPHVDEVAHGYPACGETGRELSRILLRRHDIPLGLVAEHPDIYELLGMPVPDAFSILNVSKRPLQEAAYTENGIEPPHDIAGLMKLKELIEKGAGLDTKHRDPVLRKLRDSIYAEFETYCVPVLEGYRIVIPCGRFARLFTTRLREQRPDLGFRVIQGIPHPATIEWKDLDDNTQSNLRRYIGLQ